MKKEKNYIVGEESKKLLNALEKLQEFETSFLDALTLMYGEEDGNKQFNEHTPKLDDVGRIVMDYLRINFVSEMGVGKEVITL